MDKEAVELVDKMNNKCYLLSSKTFGIVISCVVKRLEFSYVCELEDDFIKKGRKLGFDVYVLIIESSLSCKDIARALKYLSQMVSDARHWRQITGFPRRCL